MTAGPHRVPIIGPSRAAARRPECVSAGHSGGRGIRTHGEVALTAVFKIASGSPLPFRIVPHFRVFADRARFGVPYGSPSSRAALRLLSPCCPHMAPVAGRSAVGIFTRDQAALIARPRFHVGALPDLPHFQHYVWPGEVVAADELLHALTADAEHAPDLCRPH